MISSFLWAGFPGRWGSVSNLYQHGLDDGHWLFLFAHPDDDVLVAGSIYELVARGNRVELAWLTDSSSLGGRLRRQAECRGVAHVLDVPQDRVHFLDLPSLEMVPNLENGAATLTQFISAIGPTRVMVVAFEAGHIDHDCVNFLTYEARHRASLPFPIYEYPLYTGHGGWFHVNRFFSPHERQTLSPEALQRKRLSLHLYASQWPYMAVARWVTGNRLWEPYRLCPPDRRHERPPHAGSLNIDRIYNRFMRYRFADFARSLERVRTF